MLLDPARARETSPKCHSGYLLLTGATGFLGKFLLRDLTQSGFKVAVLVRPNNRLTAEQRIESIMQHWERETGTKLSRPVILEGSITEANLGLSEENRDWVEAHVESILHNAALVQFNADSHGEPWNTNVQGTNNVIELTRQAGVENLFYVSTAYCCGLQKGLVYEDRLHGDLHFRNDYEKSKFVAETLVRNSDIKNVTVFRPSVIVGDSKTGYTSSYHGLYVYLRLMALLIPNIERDNEGVAVTPIKLPFTGHERRNLVPVDWVSAVINQLVNEPNAHGKSFHLTPDDSITPRQLIGYCCNYFNTTGVEYADDVDADEEVAENCDSEFAAKFLANTGMYQAYDTSDPKFDRSNLEELVKLPCPILDEQTIQRFIEFGEADNWGKCRQPVPQSDFWLIHEEDRIVDAISNTADIWLGNDNREEIEIGMNVVGPGGGQRTFLIADNQVTCRPGISNLCDILIESESSDLADQLFNHNDQWDELLKTWLEKALADPSISQVA